MPGDKLFYIIIKDSIKGSTTDLGARQRLGLLRIL